MRFDGLTIAVIGTTLVLIAFILSWYKTGNDSHWIIKWLFVFVGISVGVIIYIKLK